MSRIAGAWWSGLMIGLTLWATPALPQSTSVDALVAQVDEGRRAYGKGDLTGAMRAFLWVENWLAPVAPPDHGVWASSFVDRARVLIAAGRIADGRALAERAIEIIVEARQDTRPPKYNADHYDHVACGAEAVIAEAAFVQRRFGDAVDHGRNAAAKLEAENNECVAFGTLARYFALKALNRGAEAQRLIAPVRPFAPGPQVSLGDLAKDIDRARAAHDYPAALILYRRALATLDAPHLAGVRQSVRNVLVVGWAEVAHKADAAGEAVEAASIGLQEGPDDESRPKLLLARGEALFNLGRFNESELELRRAYGACKNCADKERMTINATLRRLLQLRGAWAEADQLRVEGY